MRDEKCAETEEALRQAWRLIDSLGEHQSDEDRLAILRSQEFALTANRAHGDDQDWPVEMTPGPGDSATWPAAIGPRDPRYDDSVDTLVEDALSLDGRHPGTARPRRDRAIGTSMGGVQGSDFQGAGTHWEFAMIRYYHDIEQGSDEWLAVRQGILTASEMLLILTPTMRTASNDKERAHLFELSASASPATPSRTTSATTCYAGTKMRSRRASDTQNISLQSQNAAS